MKESRKELIAEEKETTRIEAFSQNNPAARYLTVGNNRPRKSVIKVHS